MIEPGRFLHSFAQSISTMALYGPGHPARERAIDTSWDLLRVLQQGDPTPQFSFLGHEVVYGQRVLRELREWDWSARLANAGVQRLEFTGPVEREDF